MKKICITSSSYVLLVYILLNKNDYKKTIYITGDKLIKDLNVKNFKILRIPIVPNIVNKIFNYLYFSFKFRDKVNYIVYGQDHLSASNFFVSKYKFILIEDGLSFHSNYITKLKEKFLKEKFLKKSIRKICKINYHHGLDEKIKEIYVSNLGELSKEYRNKDLKYFNIQELWENVGEKKQQEIVKFYNIDKNILNFEFCRESYTLLLTQPLSEDRYITEQEKIAIYSKIIKENKKIIIKPHPRERTIYEKYFKDIRILDKEIPIELYSLLGIKFNKIVSLFSTGILNSFLDCDREILGTMQNRKLEIEFGKIDYSLKKANKKGME